jgi:hypothetical protein
MDNANTIDINWVNNLPTFLKRQIALCFRTPTAQLIQNEIERIKQFEDRDKLFTEETIWSIMVINWYEYHGTDEKRYRQDRKLGKDKNSVKYELKIAKEIHICIEYDREINTKGVNQKGGNQKGGNYMDYNLQRGKNEHLKIIHAIEKLHNDEFKTYISTLL